MNELDPILKQDFPGIKTWHEMQTLMGTSDTDIIYKSDEDKIQLACELKKISIYELFFICVVAVALPVLEFLWDGNLWCLCLIPVDIVYLLIHKYVGSVYIRLGWLLLWPGVMLQEQQNILGVIWITGINLYILWFLLYLWNKSITNVCLEKMRTSEMAFYDAWHNRIASLKLCGTWYIHKNAPETTEERKPVTSEEAKPQTKEPGETIEQENEEQDERLRYFNAEFVKRFGKFNHPVTGKAIRSVQDYIEAIEAEAGKTTSHPDKMTAAELDQYFTDHYSDDDRTVDGMKGYLELFDLQQKQKLDAPEEDDEDCDFEYGSDRDDPESGEEDENTEYSNPLEELDALIGMDGLKQDVRELVYMVRMQQYRKEHGLKELPLSLHLVFTGNPGTGKTTVARILGKLYKEIGVLEKGQVVEVDRGDLVGQWMGHTAVKTKKKIKEAMGGILFVDEAYSLVKERDTFGEEAIDTILKAMEDHRDKFIVIVAGYPEPMKRFINSNPGLKSRFNKVFEFPDYNKDELYEIFQRFCKSYNYAIDRSAKEMLRKRINRMVMMKDSNFANARDIRNMFERIIAIQACRVMNRKDLSYEEMMTITEEDLYYE